MFNIPYWVVTRRGQTVYLGTPGFLCFYLTTFGVQNGSVVFSPPVGSQIFLEISHDLIPIGTSTEDAQTILREYIEGPNIIIEDAAMFKLVFPDWEADKYYYHNAPMSVGMNAFAAIEDMTSVAGQLPPDFPNLYWKPLERTDLY